MSAYRNDMGKMSDRVAAIEQSLKQIANAKRQLCRNTAEAKSRIQCNISRQLETLRNREVWLLHQLDLVSGAKEEVLQQQSVRLYKSLGVLQSAQTPEKGLTSDDVGDLQPEETPFVSFQADATSLREAIMNYGKIDSNSVQHIQSPFMMSDQQAPSLPRQFEDYNDAEHHILYKTVEEVNRSKSGEPCVFVNIPKLSCRVEDWLMKPLDRASSMLPSMPKSAFSHKVSNNLSDWLKSPLSTMSSTSSEQGSLPVMGGMSADASVKTWLHKIKQNPFEEDEEDYDFIDEISETRTQVSDGLERFPCLEDEEEEEVENIWLNKGQPGSSSENVFTFKPTSLPSDKWLLKSSGCKVVETLPSVVDMSRYFSKITDEIDKWLASSSHAPSDTPTSSEYDCHHLKLRPTVPGSLDLPWTIGGHVSRKDNPWLLKTSVRSLSGGAMSPVSSRRSSITSVTSGKFGPTANKWLLQPDMGRRDRSSSSTCSFLEKYKQDMDAVSWLKGENTACGIKYEVNPMSRFQLECDSSVWLKPSKFTSEVFDEGDSPLKALMDQVKCSGNSDWLLKSHGPQLSTTTDTMFQPCFIKGDNEWLMHSTSPFDLVVEDLEETDL